MNKEDGVCESESSIAELRACSFLLTLPIHLSVLLSIFRHRDNTQLSVFPSSFYQKIPLSDMTRHMPFRGSFYFKWLTLPRVHSFLVWVPTLETETITLAASVPCSNHKDTKDNCIYFSLVFFAV